METQAVLDRVRAAGVNLALRGDKLIAAPADLVTPEILALLRAHKPELLTALAPRQPIVSEASKAEVTRLVRHFSSSLGFSQKDADEALQVALAHPESALDYYRREVARLGDPQIEARRTRVLKMLADNPESRRAVLTHDPGNPEDVIVAQAIRGLATFELRIPREKYDGILLLDLIERHGATIH